MDKIVFFDLDGTLLDDDKNIPQSAREAVFKLKDKGIHVAFATGRAPFMIDEIQEQLEVDTFVCFNGQYVVLNNEVIYKNPLKSEDLEQFAKRTKAKGHPLVYLNEKTMKATEENNLHIEKSMKTLRFPYPKIDEQFFNKSEIYQTLLFCEESDEHLYVNKYERFQFIRWHPYSLDVLPLGGLKAVGIQKIAERLNIKNENIIAFGDGLNDIEMIKEAGVGVVMENGVSVLKEHAQLIAKRPSEDGVWESLKQLKLI